MTFSPMRMDAKMSDKIIVNSVHSLFYNEGYASLSPGAVDNLNCYQSYQNEGQRGVFKPAFINSSSQVHFLSVSRSLQVDFLSTRKEINGKCIKS